MQYDVTVIGGGPAGMAAALSAARAGASVALLETEPLLGGILNQCIHNGFGLHLFGEELTGPEFAARYRSMVENSKIQVYLNTLATQILPGLQVCAVSQTLGALCLETGAVVVATGCRERPRGAIGIAGTRPAGILTAGTAQYFVNIRGFLPGKRCVILGSGDIGLIMARRMTFEGAKVEAVVELMPYSSGLARNCKQCLEDFDIPLLLSHTVTQIHGRDRVEGVTIARVDSERRPIEKTERRIDCDCLLLSVGLVPEIDLALDAGASPSLRTRSVSVDQNFETSLPGVFACGNTLHVHDLVDNVALESEQAGARAAQFALFGALSSASPSPICAGSGVSYVVPQFRTSSEALTLRFRTMRVFKNCRVVVSSDGRIIKEARRRILAPGEMESLSLPCGIDAALPLEVSIQEEHT